MDPVCAAYILVTRLFIYDEERSVNLRCGLPKTTCEQLIEDSAKEVLPRGWRQVVTCEEKAPPLTGEQNTRLELERLLRASDERLVDDLEALGK